MSIDALFSRAFVSPVLRALEGWKVGRLTIDLPDGRTVAFGAPEAHPRARLRVKTPAAFRRLVTGGDLGFGESYMDGEWEADDLAVFLKLAVRNEEYLPLSSPLSRLLGVGNDLRHRLNRNSRRGSRRNIERHYDLSNDFFRLFLDETMTYSSALFEWEGQPLADAQRGKYRALAEKARLRPEDHVLEIGCGWGGFALFAAREYGCRVTGITISRRQLRMARERVAAAGLRDRVEIRLQDYRDLVGRFDKVVSIEMFEALGREHWPVFFAKVDEVLAPSGIAALQTISIPDHRFEEYSRRCDWIQKHIFPGGVLASIHHVTGAMIEGSSFHLHHLEDIGIHYALTLARWREAFLARADDVRALGFDERFVRTWDYYLAVCEAMFETRRLGDLQLVFTRQGNDALGGIPATAPREVATPTEPAVSRPVSDGREEAA
jgi:cyclopropane-fatty-acyl-phospholipid synthase